MSCSTGVFETLRDAQALIERWRVTPSVAIFASRSMPTTRPSDGSSRATRKIAAVRPTLVLDLGAGTGALSEAILEHEGVGAVEAIDVDAEMLDRARIRLKRF